MKVTIWKDKRRKWRWTLKARNGVQIGASSQGYRRKIDCKKNMRQVVEGLANETVTIDRSRGHDALCHMTIYRDITSGMTPIGVGCTCADSS